MNELAEQRRVGLLGVSGLAAFVAQILQKVFDQILHASPLILNDRGSVEGPMAFAACLAGRGLSVIDRHE